ncbi:hypothetical protein [Aliamphritea spongicola]|nr:hypothetical protein [Aliamphritea spongicola]
MSLLNVFAQLEQAYILVGADSSEPLLVNKKAAMLTGLDVSTPEGRDTWQQILLPAIEMARTVKNTQVYLGEKPFTLLFGYSGRWSYCYCCAFKPARAER